ncbi:MAG: hypothetical protein GXP55_20040 [Deltaproteobacteria bacterium]|nr:hypothetical protein [Deltaproteobacteria bacterium]
MASRILILSLIWLPTLVGCYPRPTEAIVRVDVDEALAAGAYRLCMRVRDPVDGSLDGETCLDAGEYTWPATLPIHARPGVEQRAFAFEAELLDGDTRVAITRARAVFVPHRSRELRLRLTAACAGSCAGVTTCVGGSCVPACFELTASGDVVLSVPMACSPDLDAGSADAGEDGGLDGGGLDGGLDGGGLDGGVTDGGVTDAGPEPIVELPFTSEPVVVDGTLDAHFALASTQAITRLVDGTVANSADLSGVFQALWDRDNLYLFIAVRDDLKSVDSPSAVYADDGVEIYIDANWDRRSTYGPDDHHYLFRRDDSTVYELQHGRTEGVVMAQLEVSDGYALEVSIPWATLGQRPPLSNGVFGLDIQLNDDDDGGARDGAVEWYDPEGNSYRDPRRLAMARLIGG